MSITDFIQGKQKLRILILGAYKPSKALKRLEKLRDCLIKKGFESAKLARDFPDDKQYSEDLDEHYTKKSRDLIANWAHVPIFIFFQKADNQGVATEIAYTCDMLQDKQSSCTAFFEGKLEDFSSQVKGSIKITKRVSYETFADDEELCNLAVGHSLKILDILFYYLS